MECNRAKVHVHVTSIDGFRVPALLLTFDECGESAEWLAEKLNYLIGWKTPGKPVSDSQTFRIKASQTGTPETLKRLKPCLRIISKNF